MLQLQQVVQDGSTRIFALESQVILEQDKYRELQYEITTKDEEVSWLLVIPPPVEVSQDFSPILVELYVSHWERIKQYCPSLQPMLRLLREAQSLYVEAGTLINNSMLFIGPKIPIA